MTKYDIKTKRGYDFYECASALQKGIRRADVKVAGYFALELWSSGYDTYVWKRLLTISAEDCYGLITQEVKALMDSYMFINKGAKEKKGRVFISKAVLLLCDVRKSRDADHLQNLIYDRENVQIEEWMKGLENEVVQIPSYTFDCHTLKGKMMGKTKEDFFRDELNSLTPREPSLFDNLVL